eukprot:COSAG05_NODE_280_length_12288_cov_4.797933_18_plen_41_part_00
MYIIVVPLLNLVQALAVRLLLSAFSMITLDIVAVRNDWTS